MNRLRLDNYAGVYHATALKVIHLGDEDETVTREHTHDFYELVVVQRGEGLNIVNGREYPVRAGSMFLMYPGERHHYQWKTPLSLLTFMFDSVVVRRQRSNLAQLPVYLQLFSGVRKPKELIYVNAATIAEAGLLLDAIASETQLHLPGAELAIEAALSSLMVLLLRNSSSSVPVVWGGRLGEAVSYMLRHYDRDISLAMLAKIAAMSPSVFSNKFKREYSVPPLKWLLEYRLKKASQLLLRTDMNISGIAAATGFADPLYFSRQFKKTMGISPREYSRSDHERRQIHKGEQTESYSGLRNAVK